MALRSGYKGIKKLAAGLKWNRPGILAADDTALAKVFFPRSEQAVLGAKNIWDDSIALSSNASATVTKTTDGYAVQTNTTANSGGQFNQTPLRTRYTPFGNIAVSFEYKSDIACAGYIGKSDVTLATDWTKVSYSVDGSTMGAICFYNRDTTKTPLIEVRNMMITLATDTDPSFVPPAMTNRELTDAVGNKVDFNAIFLPAKFANVYTGDLNDLPCGVRYIGANAANSPHDWSIVLTFSTAGSDMPTAAYGAQIAIGSGYSGMYYRRKDNGTWQSWQSITLS